MKFGNQPFALIYLYAKKEKYHQIDITESLEKIPKDILLDLIDGIQKKTLKEEIKFDEYGRY